MTFGSFGIIIVGLWYLLAITFQFVNGNATPFSLQTGSSKNLSCPHGIKKLAIDSINLNRYCNSSFHAWQLLCHDRIRCLVQNTCNQTMNMTYFCREKPFGVLITDLDPSGSRFNCSCNCTKNRHLNLTHGRKLIDFTCFCNCEERFVPRFQINSTEMDQRLAELKQTLTVTKSQTKSYLRKKTSTKDSRTSSTTIGVFGILILTIVVGSILLIDIPRIRLTFLRSVVYRKCRVVLEMCSRSD